jgi:PAS domain S-box-containing protein
LLRRLNVVNEATQYRLGRWFMTLQVDRSDAPPVRRIEFPTLPVEQLPVAYILSDVNGLIVDWNPAAEKLFGYSKEDALGNDGISLLVPDSLVENVRDVMRQAWSTGNDVHHINENWTKDGSLITCEWFNTPLNDADGRLVGVASMAQDITERIRLATKLKDGETLWAEALSLVHNNTERMQTEETLRKYADQLRNHSQRVIDMQEEERRHLARELHDELGQVLSAISVNLQSVKIECGPSVLPPLEECISILDIAVQQVRSLSLDLRPSLLDDVGLLATLHWYVDRQAERGGFRMHFVQEASGMCLPADMEITCFRIIQEALTNIARHAQARNVWITYQESEDEKVILTIRDDGVGLDLEDIRKRAERGASFGIRGMRERVELLSGHIEIESLPGEGTTIRASLPLPEETAEPTS